MSEISVSLTTCNYCGEVMRGRLDNGDYRTFSGVKSKGYDPELCKFIHLDFCCDCWKFCVSRSKDQKELFQLIEKEVGYIISDYKYVNWNYVEEWKSVE